MSTPRETLLAVIAAEEGALVGMLSDFVRAPSPNPPGDTRAAAAVLARWVFMAAARFTFEDAYISLRYAENLAAGLGMVYNPGEPVFGASTPLYVLFLAGLARLGLGHEALLARLGDHEPPALRLDRLLLEHAVRELVERLDGVRVLVVLAEELLLRVVHLLECHAGAHLLARPLLLHHL